MGLSTALMVASYLMFLYGLSAVSGQETTFGGGLIGIALGLVPGVFAVAALVSQRERPVSATMAAMALWFVVTAPLALADIPVALVAGFGAGGIVALRKRTANRTTYRIVAVLITVVYTLALRALLPEVGLFAGSALPLLAITAADIYTEKFVG